MPGLPEKDYHRRTERQSRPPAMVLCANGKLSEVERTESHLLGDVVYHDGYPLPDNTVIQWWNYRGHKDLALRNAVKHHYPVICSSNYYTYLNFPVTPWKGYTEARTFDLKDVYLNNPSDKAISEKNPLILGMSCALWTDDGVTERMIDRRLFPRILALSEQMWHEGKRLTSTGSTGTSFTAKHGSKKLDSNSDRL